MTKPSTAALALTVGLLGPSPLATTASAATSPTSVCTLDRATGTTFDSRPEIANGYAAHYNAPAGRVAFMQPDTLGYYRAMTMRVDGTDVRAVDAGSFAIPRKHQGSPAWHPSGRYLIFTVEKSAWSGRRLFGIPDYEAIPGYGRHDDLWVATPDGRSARMLIDEPNTKDQGILIPVFSPDGKHVAWSDRQPGGTYELKVADFVALPVRISRTRARIAPAARPTTRRARSRATARTLRTRAIRTRIRSGRARSICSTLRPDATRASRPARTTTSTPSSTRRRPATGSST